MIQISHACPPLTEYLFSLWAKISQPWTDCSAFCALRLWEWQIDLKVITHELPPCSAGHWMLQIWNGNQENNNTGPYFQILFLFSLPLKKKRLKLQFWFQGFQKGWNNVYNTLHVGSFIVMLIKFKKKWISIYVSLHLNTHLLLPGEVNSKDGCSGPFKAGQPTSPWIPNRQLWGVNLVRKLAMQMRESVNTVAD